jgi:hypothetical protein
LHLPHNFEADEAQGMIDEMSGGEAEQHKTRQEPQALQGIPSGQNAHDENRAPRTSCPAIDTDIMVISFEHNNR